MESPTTSLSKRGCCSTFLQSLILSRNLSRQAFLLREGGVLDLFLRHLLHNTPAISNEGAAALRYSMQYSTSSTAPACQRRVGQGLNKLSSAELHTLELSVPSFLVA